MSQINLNLICTKKKTQHIIFSVVAGVRAPGLTYFMHCLYQLSYAHEDKLNILFPLSFIFYIWLAFIFFVL